MRKLLVSLLLLAGCMQSWAQTDAQMDAYRKSFDAIIYSPVTDAEKIARIKSEIPAVFMEKKGFYVLTKAVEIRSFLFLDFVLLQKGVNAGDGSDVVNQGILSYLPWDSYSLVKPGTCVMTDTLLDLRKKLTAYLVSKGASIGHVDANGGNIMSRAVYQKDLAFLEYLYEANNRKFVNAPGNDLLYTAANLGCLDIVKWLVEKGFDVNTPNKYEGSAIGSSVSKPEIVQYLIAKGANVNLANGYGWTPLMYAVNRGNLESVKLLLNAGADISAKNSKGWDVFEVGKQYKQKAILKFLKEYKK